MRGESEQFAEFVSKNSKNNAREAHLLAKRYGNAHPPILLNEQASTSFAFKGFLLPLGKPHSIRCLNSRCAFFVSKIHALPILLNESDLIKHSRI